MFQLPHPAFARARALDALPSPTTAIEIRLAGQADANALVRLAQLDSALAAAAELPARARRGDVLVAESRGKLVAALSLGDGLLLADPFTRSEPLIALLHARRGQIVRGERRQRRGRLGVLRPRHL
jgi:hypothetical protein